MALSALATINFNTVTAKIAATVLVPATAERLENTFHGPCLISCYSSVYTSVTTRWKRMVFQKVSVVLSMSGLFPLGSRAFREISLIEEYHVPQSCSQMQIIARD